MRQNPDQGPNPDPVGEDLFLPMMKLSKDLKLAADQLGATEVRFLVDSYYLMQDGRIRASGQIRSMERAPEQEPHGILTWLMTQLENLEGQVKSALFVYDKSKDMGRWLMSIYGIGPVITAGLLAHIDWTKPTVGHIWRFAGLDPTSKWVKGERRPWNASLKTLCVHPESRVATRRGYIPISQVKVGDEVLTHQSRWRKVTQVFENQYEGSIYKFRAANSCNMGGWFTEGHPVYAAPVETYQYGNRYTVKEKTRQDFGWHAVESLKPRWRLKRPVFSSDGWPAPQPMVLKGIEVGEMVIAGGRWPGVQAPRAKAVPREVKLTKEFMRLVGLYLSEGHTNRNHIGFSFHKEEEDLQLFVKEQLIKMTDGAAHFNEFVNDDNNSIQIMLGMKPLVDFFTENFGSGSMDARFPMEWFGLDQSLLKSLWLGLMEGDGDHQGTYAGRRYTTTSETLAYQVMELGRMLGKSISMHKEKDREGVAPVWRIHENERQDTTPSLTALVQVHYQGPVFNLEVEEDTSYVVEGFAVHNCWKVGESFIKVQNKPKDVYGKEYAIRKQFEVVGNDDGRYSDQALVRMAQVKKTTESYKWYAGCYPAGTTAAYMALASIFEKQDLIRERASLLKDRALKEGEGLPMLSPPHINSRARRYAVKLFLSHAHFVGLFLSTGRLAPNPYPIAHCGHAHVIPPPNLDEIAGLRAAWEERQRKG
jgi:intein/homing endonuclease